MESTFNPSTVTFIVGMLGVLFAIYRYFKEPQVAADKRDALIGEQMNWMKEGVDNRFKSMQEQIAQLVAQSQNHIHTVDTKVDNVNKSLVEMGREIVKLQTIIEERIPKK